MVETVFLTLIFSSLVGGVLFVGGYWYGLERGKRLKSETILAHHVLDISAQAMRMHYAERNETPDMVQGDRQTQPAAPTPTVTTDDEVGASNFEFPTGGSYLGPAVQVPHSSM